MTKENSGPNNPTEAAAAASDALGGMVMGEAPPFPADKETTDQANEIADIFGLGEEAGPAPNSSEGSSDGGASPSGANPAAEGGEGQAKPATPSTSQPSTEQQGASQATAQPREETPPAPAAPPAGSEAGQAQASTTQEPSVQALRAQVDALIAQNAQLLERLQQPQGAGSQAPQQGFSGQQGQQGQTPEADPYMDYRFAIPDDVAGAIFNEDPQVARQGLSHLINSLGRIVHERTLRSVTERVLPQVLGEFQGNLSLSTQQEQMRNEYFGAFPQHNDPGTRLIVAQEAQAMWTQNPQLQWNKDAMNALGSRVNQRLGYSAQPQQQQPQPQQANGSAQGQPAPRPAAQMGASNRPPVSGDNDENFISSVLSAG